MKNKGICYKIDVTFTKESKKMIEKVKQYAEQWHMLKKEDRIIVGVSFCGPCESSTERGVRGF